MRLKRTELVNSIQSDDKSSHSKDHRHHGSACSGTVGRADGSGKSGRRLPMNTDQSRRSPNCVHQRSSVSVVVSLRFVSSCCTVSTCRRIRKNSDALRNSQELSHRCNERQRETLHYRCQPRSLWPHSKMQIGPSQLIHAAMGYVHAGSWFSRSAIPPIARSVTAEHNNR